MGVYLSSPDTTKHSNDGQNARFKYGASAMQGWRLNMEDAHITDVDFGPEMSLFAVFDGHGGPEVAKFCENNFGRELKANPNFEAGKYGQALTDTFFKMDEMLFTPEGQAELSNYKENPANAESNAGCTAVVMLIVGKTLYVANAGDSRAILWSNGKVIPLSEDHKPENDIEKTRIAKAGGFIMDGRVNGNLNLSRALGDLEYKKNPGLTPSQQLISAEPDIVTRELGSGDEFIVMGCDGIWEILTAEEICHLAENNLKENKNGKLSAAVEEILDRSLAPDTSRKF